MKQLYGDADPNVLYLSPSGLNLVNECPRCFTLEKTLNPNVRDLFRRGVPRPRGIFPGLPSGMDSVLKAYHNQFRTEGRLPPYLEGKIPGVLFQDHERLRKLQYWKTGPRYETTIDGIGVVLRGGIDELLKRDDGLYSTGDFKSKGSQPKDDGSQYYQTQLDGYQLALEHSGFKMSSASFLIYFWPSACEESDLMGTGLRFDFHYEVCTLQASSERAKALIEEAFHLATSSVLCEASPTCEYCHYAESRERAVPAFNQ